MLETVYYFLKGPVLYLFLYSFAIFSVVLIFNFYDQKKSLSVLKKESSFVFRPSFLKWSTFIKKRKNYSIYPYIPFGLALAYGIVYGNLQIIVVAFAYLLWKQISLYWPVSIVFSREGIFTWDPYGLVFRKNFESELSWDAVNDIYYLVDTEEVVIETDYVAMICPLSKKEALELSKWLDANHYIYSFSASAIKSTSL